MAFTRESYPKNIDLAVDMHGRYDAGTAKRVAKELEPFKLMWLEEPVPPENIDAMRDVRASTTTPICCGENIYMRWGFREMFEKQAVDIIMPDFQKCGGLLEARKIADMAHTYFIPVAPHAVTSPIGMMATAHVCAAIPNFLVQEWHWIDSPGAMAELGEGRRDHREGLYHPARAPGHRRGDERRRRQESAGAGHAVVRAGAGIGGACESGGNGGADPLVRSRPPGRLVEEWQVIDSSRKERVRGDPRGPGGPPHHKRGRPQQFCRSHSLKAS